MLKLEFDTFLDIESAVISAETMAKGLTAVANDQLQCLEELPNMHEFFIYRAHAIMQLLHDLQGELAGLDALVSGIKSSEDKPVQETA